jgi:acetylornithine deacetylase
MKSFSADMVKEGRSWDKIVFGEPTENKIAIGHKGMVLFNISCSGKASHSGYPELGSSANEKLIDVLHELKHHAWPVDKVLGNTTFNIGKITGGVAANVVPASASASLSIRVSRDLEGILTYLRNVVATSPDTSFEIMQAAVPTVLDSLEGTKFEEMVVK